MNPNPALGVFFHWLGGLASGSFYVPYRGVKRWAWETYWLVGGFFQLDHRAVDSGSGHDPAICCRSREAPASSIFWACIFGFYGDSVV